MANGKKTCSIFSRISGIQSDFEYKGPVKKGKRHGLQSDKKNVGACGGEGAAISYSQHVEDCIILR